jgi:3-dehydroquinate synthase
MTHEFSIDLVDHEINVLVGAGLVSQLSTVLRDNASSNCFYVLIDSQVLAKYRDHLEPFFQELNVNFFALDARKKNKTFAAAMKVFADLDDKNVSRDVTLVAVGGGVIGDLGGFIASCWYRGVELIHVPTTLLAAVDSCLGGKTALNFRNTVNAVGTYHHPSTIIIDSEVLMALPVREIHSGFGEIIKYAALGSDEILEHLSSPDVLTSRRLATLVALSLKQKEKYVAGDVKEAANRLYLNFGHTIGHAIEFSTVYDGEETFRHGEGVALGMLAIFRICVILGYLDEADVDRLASLLVQYKLPTKLRPPPESKKHDHLVELITRRAFKDKKRTSEGLRLVLLDGWGKPFIFPTTDEGLIRAGVEELVP